MRPGADYPARTLRFPEDRVIGDVRLITDGRPGDAIPAQGEIDVPAGVGAGFWGVPAVEDLAEATGLTHLFLGGEIDDRFAELLTTFPYLRQLNTGTRGLTPDGIKKLLAAPHVAGIDLNVEDEEAGGAPIFEAAAATDDVEVRLVLGPAAIARVCDSISAGTKSPTVTIDVSGGDERALLPLRKLVPDQEINGIRYSPKALERLEASLTASS